MGSSVNRFRNQLRFTGIYHKLYRPNCLNSNEFIGVFLLYMELEVLYFENIRVMYQQFDTQCILKHMVLCYNNQ